MYDTLADYPSAAALAAILSIKKAASGSMAATWCNEELQLMSSGVKEM